MNNLGKKIGIVYHGRLDAAIDLSLDLEKTARKTVASVWRAAAADEEGIRAQAIDSDVVVAVGGDGTLLRAARALAGCPAPILGVNLGKVGFMTELTASEAMENMPRIMAVDGWIDTRAMLESSHASREDCFIALNDVVLGRGATCRIVCIETRIDGRLLTTYRADGVIVATATGSTSYALAAGGPIAYPQSRDILLQPVSPHLSLSRCLVLPPDAIIELAVATDRPATLSIDGQVDIPVLNGERVTVRLSNKVVRFLRFHPPTHFYESLTHKLKGEMHC